MIAHAGLSATPVLSLPIAMVETTLGARAVTPLRAPSRLAPTSSAAHVAVDLPAVAGHAERKCLQATPAAKLDPVVVHAPQRAEILAPLPELCDGPPVHAPAGHEGREVQLLALDLCRASPS